MLEQFRETLSSSPSQSPGSYIYSVLPIAGNRLAVLTSADELLILDKAGLEVMVRFHDDVPSPLSCMADCENVKNNIICAGTDGEVAIFDVRIERRVSHFKIDRAVTALAHHNHEIAVGSELAHSQATISIWDERSRHIRWQSSENNDDITALRYHSNGIYLLSGGDDGLVSVFDTNIQEDNDSLLRAFNHGPIHKAGFISDAFDSPIYALSSDQQLSIHPADGFEINDSEVIQPAIFGDLRPKLQCDYVIDIFRGIGQPYVVAGSHLTHPHIDFIPLLASPSFALSDENIIRLHGAHGEEIVRSVYMDKTAEAIFTAGEDGCVKAFRASNALIESSFPAQNPPVKTVKEGKKIKAGRFNPY